MIATRIFFPWGATSGSGVSTTVDNFLPPSATTNPTWQNQFAAREAIVGSTFKTVTLRADLTAAPGAGASRTFTLLKNGVATPLTLTISNAATTGSASAEVTFTDGDTIILQTTPSTGTAPAAASAYGYLVVEGTINEGFPVLGGNFSNAVTATDTFHPLQGFSNISWDTNDNTKQVSPMYGVLKNFRVTLNGSPGNGTSYVTEIYKNGSGTGISVTISDLNQTGVDTTHSVEVVPGDLLSVRHTRTGSPSNRAIRWGLEWIPSNPGYSAIMYRNFNTQQPSTSATRFNLPASRGIGAWNATETNAQNICPAITAKNLYIWQSVAPGLAASGKQYVHTLRKGAAGTSPAVTILETATTGNNVADLAYADGDKISLQTVPTSTPAATDVSTGVMFFLRGGFIANSSRAVGTTRPAVM